MSTLGRITATPVEITLGGETYRMVPPSVKVLSELHTWLEAYPLIKAGRRIEQLPANLPPEMTAEIWDKAKAESDEIAEALASGNEGITDMLSNLDTVCKFLHLCLLPERPEITLAQVEGMIGPNDLDEVSNKLNAFMGLTEDEAKNLDSPSNEGRGQTAEATTASP